MSVIYDTFRKIERERAERGRSERSRMLVRGNRESRTILMSRAKGRSFKVLTVTSNKGGVGKTTISTNLAVYFRALREDLPILILGLDDQSTLDRMFALDDKEPEHTVATGLRAGTFKNVIRLGQYGVHYIPSAPNASELKHEINDPLCLLDTLQRTEWNGLVIVDTKSDLEILTRNAVAASDLLLVPVKNDTSLQEAKKVFQLLDEWGWPRERARVVLSMIDRRIKFRQGEQADVLSLLLSEVRKLGYPLLESFISGSPKVESLSTNPSGRVTSVLQGAGGSIVHKQMHHVAQEVLDLLENIGSMQASAGPIEIAAPTEEEVEVDLETEATPPMLRVAPKPAPEPEQPVRLVIPGQVEPEPPEEEDDVIDVTPEESREAFREARVLIDRWKRQSSGRNPFSSRNIWRRKSAPASDDEKTGTK